MSETLTLHQAAKLIAAAPDQVHDVEVRLAQAIEHGTLPASIQRWATEQWQGQQLPGNLNRLETRILRSDLDAWVSAQS